MRKINALLLVGLMACSCPVLAQMETATTPVAEEAMDPLAGTIEVRLVSSEMIGTTRAVRGRVLEVIPSTHPRMPTRMIIRRDPLFSVLYFPDVAAQIEKSLGKPKEGMWVYAKGPVGEWRGLLELRVAEGGAIRFFAPDAEASTLPVVIDSAEQLDAIRFDAPRVMLKDLDAHAEKLVSTRVQVERYQLPANDRAPHVLRVQDGTGNVDVVFWDIAPDVDRRALREGAQLEVQGTAGRYRDRHQLRIRDPRDIRVVTAEGSPAPAPAPSSSERVAIGSLLDMKGQNVIVQGKVTGITPPWSDRAPNLLRVEDSSGAVEIVFWDAMKPRLNQDLLRENAQVRVTGEVGEHLGKIQIRINEPDQLSPASP